MHKRIGAHDCEQAICCRVRLSSEAQDGMLLARRRVKGLGGKPKALLAGRPRLAAQ